MPTWWERGGPMPAMEERVAYLEGVQGGHSHEILGLHSAIADAITDLRGDMNTLRADMNTRFAQVDARFAQVDARFAQVDARFVQVDARFVQIDGRLDRMTARSDQQFVWLLGTQIAVLLSVIAALAGAYYR